YPDNSASSASQIIVPRSKPLMVPRVSSTIACHSASSAKRASLERVAMEGNRSANCRCSSSGNLSAASNTASRFSLNLVIRLLTKSGLLDAKETHPDATIWQDTRQSHFPAAATILADML